MADFRKYKQLEETEKEFKKLVFDPNKKFKKLIKEGKCIGEAQVIVENFIREIAGMAYQHQYKKLMSEWIEREGG